MNKYLLIFVLFILSDVVADNSILKVFGSQPPLTSLLLSSGFLVLQMVAAPIQAGFSDFYCRKKTLVASLSFSFLSLLILYFTKSNSASIFLFILILFTKGGLGNTVPLTWGALADSQEKNLRFSLAISTAAYAIGYMILAVLNMNAIKNEFLQTWLLSPESIPTILFVLSIILCILYFRDIRDRKLYNSNYNKSYTYLELIHSEFKSLLKDLCRKSTKFGMLAYFLWATSQYSVLVLLTDFQTTYTSTVIWMMCGYFTGVTVLGFCKNVSDETMIKTGYIITIIALFLFFVFLPFGNIKNLLSICYFFYTMGNAFLSPSILSLFSKERGLENQGKGFGLIVSADDGGFLIASILVIFFRLINLDLVYMIVFSFVIFILSLFPYLKYEKIRKTVIRDKKIVY